MNHLESLFPNSPSYKGKWQIIFLEPIVGSGEQIAVGVVAVGEHSEYRAYQAIRSELLDCLYGTKASDMQSMIDWLLDSARTYLNKNKTLHKWTPPFEGVKVSPEVLAKDENIDGIVKQAVRFSASLSSLALDADRDDEDEQPRRYAEHWTSSIAEELKNINPSLVTNFRKRVQIGETEILTTYGFYTERYVSNFGLIVPSRLSSSLNAVKARLLDLESLQRSHVLIKPEKYELIIGTPSFDDPTLSDKSVKRLRDTVNMVQELAESEQISLFRAENATQAAQHINDIAA